MVEKGCATPNHAGFCFNSERLCLVLLPHVAPTVDYNQSVPHECVQRFENVYDVQPILPVSASGTRFKPDLV